MYNVLKKKNKAQIIKTKNQNFIKTFFLLLIKKQIPYRFCLPTKKNNNNKNYKIIPARFFCVLFSDNLALYVFPVAYCR